MEVVLKKKGKIGSVNEGRSGSNANGERPFEETSFLGDFSPAPSSSGRSLELAAEDESGIEGILNRLERQRNLSFGFKLGKNGTNVENVNGGTSDHNRSKGIRKDVDSSDPQISEPASLSQDRHLISSNGLNRSYSNRLSMKPDAWRSWSIQRDGFSDTEFEVLTTYSYTRQRKRMEFYQLLLKFMRALILGVGNDEVELMGDKSQKVMGEYMEKLEEYKNKGIEINPNKVYLEVVGGQKKGKVYGLGSASQMYYKSDPASQLTTSSFTPSMISQLSSQVEELKKMAEENHNKVEESQKIAAESLKYAKEFVENHEIEKATWKKEKLAMQKTLQEMVSLVKQGYRPCKPPTPTVTRSRDTTK